MAFPGGRHRLRRLVSRISIRLLAFNVLLVFLPVAGLLYLDTYEQRLLAAQERAMVQQGRILAAALSTGPEEMPDPDEAPDPASEVFPEAVAEPLDEVTAERLLARLDQQQTARLRVLDRGGRLLADSSRLGPLREPGTPAYDEAAVRGNRLYRLGAALFRFVRRPFEPPRATAPPVEFYRSDRPFDGPEVRAALAGRYGASTRVSPGQRSVTLYSALPVTRDGEVAGAVLVSQSTLRLLADLYDVRLAIFQVFLASVAVAVVLSLVVATTIARPLKRLEREAHGLVDRRGRLTGRFGGSRRHDEIGELARALAELSRRLETHLGFIESFAADLAHEFKNPLAAIRSATELAGEVDDPDERRRFLTLAAEQVARLERLLTELGELTEIDARLDGEERPAVALGELVTALVEGRRWRLPEGVGLELELGPEAIVVSASPDRLARVIDNLLDNALSFAPGGTAVEVELEGDDEGGAVLTVRDHGPGIPAGERQRIFHRFFTDRSAADPAAGAPGADGHHAGLGLAIVRAVVEGYGGTVTAGETPGGGAAFTVRLPAAG